MGNYRYDNMFLGEHAFGNGSWVTGNARF